MEGHDYLAGLRKALMLCLSQVIYRFMPHPKLPANPLGKMANEQAL